MGKAAVQVAESVKYEGAGTSFDKHQTLLYQMNCPHTGRVPYHRRSR